MGEYTEIEGQIARIETVHAELRGSRLRLEMGTANVGQHAAVSEGFYAKIGELIEYRPRIAGALLAIESRLADEIDDQVGGLKRLVDLRAKLKLPEIVIGGSK